MKLGSSQGRLRLPTPRHDRRRAAVIAVVCGLVIVLIAASVYSIGYRSREVVTHTVALHSVDEALRAVTVTRSQLGYAAFLASVDQRYGTDSRTVIAGTLTDARRGIADMGTALDAAETGTPVTGTDVRALADDFTDRAEHTLDLVQRGKPGAARAAAVKLDAAFERLRVELVARRDRALEQVLADDDRLGRMGALASLIVAFVVPAGIVFVYLALTRRTRAVMETEIALARERQARDRRRHLVEAAVADLRMAVARSQRAGTPFPLGRLDDLAALLETAEGSTRHRFHAVPIAGLLVDVAAATSSDDVSVEVSAGAETAWSDPAALEHLLRNLVTEAVLSRARRVRLAAATVGTHIVLSVQHDGAPLSGPGLELFGGRTSVWSVDEDDDELPPSTTLIAAVAVAERLGAALHAVAAPGPTMMVRVPAAAGTAPAAPPPGATPVEGVPAPPAVRP